MNPEIMNGSPLSVEQAWSVLATFVEEVAPEVAESTMPREEFIARAGRHRDVQDFYLVQLAADAGRLLVTHDTRLCRQWPEHTHTIR
jgi:predicted nucleic acid-binding protein